MKTLTQRDSSLIGQLGIQFIRTLATSEMTVAPLAGSRLTQKTIRPPDGILVLDAQGVVRLMNPASEALLGANSATFLGKSLQIPVLQGETAEVAITLPQGESISVEWRVREIEWAGEKAYLALLYRRHESQSEAPTLPESLELHLQSSPLFKDSQTGLQNQTALQSCLERELARSARYQTALSLALLRVDAVAEWGKLREEILRQLSTLAQSQIRDTDFAARQGDDTIALVLPHTSAVGAMQFAERLRLTLSNSLKEQFGATVSMGVASFSPVSGSVSTLLREAGQALEEAARRGGDRTTHHDALLRTMHVQNAHPSASKMGHLLYPPAAMLPIYEAMVLGWLRLLEMKDAETEGHSERVTTLTLHLVNYFGLNANERDIVRWGALLHDIGKIGVPDNILLKPGPLTADEWVIMKMHPVYAYD